MLATCARPGARARRSCPVPASPARIRSQLVSPVPEQLVWQESTAGRRWSAMTSVSGFGVQAATSPSTASMPRSRAAATISGELIDGLDHGVRPALPPGRRSGFQDRSPGRRRGAAPRRPPGPTGRRTGGRGDRANSRYVPGSHRPNITPQTWQPFGVASGRDAEHEFSDGARPSRCPAWLNGEGGFRGLPTRAGLTWGPNAPWSTPRRWPISGLRTAIALAGRCDAAAGARRHAGVPICWPSGTIWSSSPSWPRKRMRPSRSGAVGGPTGQHRPVGPVAEMAGARPRRPDPVRERLPGR